MYKFHQHDAQLDNFDFEESGKNLAIENVGRLGDISADYSWVAFGKAPARQVVRRTYVGDYNLSRYANRDDLSKLKGTRGLIRGRIPTPGAHAREEEGAQSSGQRRTFFPRGWRAALSRQIPADDDFGLFRARGKPLPFVRGRAFIRPSLVRRKSHPLQESRTKWVSPGGGGGGGGGAEIRKNGPTFMTRSRQVQEIALSYVSGLFPRLFVSLELRASLCWLSGVWFVFFSFMKRILDVPGFAAGIWIFGEFGSEHLWQWPYFNQSFCRGIGMLGDEWSVEPFGKSATEVQESKIDLWFFMVYYGDI